MRTFFGVLGVTISVVSGMFVAMAIGDLVDGTSETSRSTLVGMLALFLGAAFWGLQLAAHSFHWRRPAFLHLRRRRSSREIEQAVLAYATSVGGRVTILDVAAHCDLTVDESKATLDHFAARNVADLVVTDDGTLIYDFDFLSPREKAAAKDVLS